MKKVSFTYWRDGKFFIGFLNQYPDYQTQGKSKSELMDSLKDLLLDIESREVPYSRSTVYTQGRRTAGRVSEAARPYQDA